MSKLVKGSRQAIAWGRKMQALRKAACKNPQGFFNIEKSAFHRGEYVGYGNGVWRIVKYGTGWNAGRKDPQAHFTAPSLAAVSAKLKQYATNKNPGQSWHEGEAAAAHRVVRGTTDQDEKLYYAGVETAHRISASAAKKLKMNRPRKRRHTPARPQRARSARCNPLAVFGFPNPPKEIHAKVEGIVYSRVHDIYAEKLVNDPGLYHHPFSKRAKVQILALDSGDLLVHSTAKVNLWKPS